MVCWSVARCVSRTSIVRFCSSMAFSYIFALASFTALSVALASHEFFNMTPLTMFVPISTPIAMTNH